MSISDKKTWTNEYGDMNPNSWDVDSENPSTFNAMYWLLLHELRCLTLEEWGYVHKLVKDKYETNDGKFKTNNFDNDDSFSLDESMSVGAMSVRFGYSDCLSKLRVLTKSTYLRFYDVIPYIIGCKYAFLRPFLRPFVSLNTILAVALLPLFKLFYRDHNRRIRIRMNPKKIMEAVRNDSSGVQLSLIKCFGWEMDFTQDVVEKVLKWQGSTYADRLNKYYPEPDHPTNRLARRMWGTNE